MLSIEEVKDVIKALLTAEALVPSAIGELACLL